MQAPFQVEHEEAVLEDWLEFNPDGIVEDGRILIIGRRVVTNFGGFIDLLGLDREGDVVVVELKRDRTPRDTIAQSLEYVSFADGSLPVVTEDAFLALSRRKRQGGFRPDSETGKGHSYAHPL